MRQEIEQRTYQGSGCAETALEKEQDGQAVPCIGEARRELQAMDQRRFCFPGAAHPHGGFCQQAYGAHILLGLL